MTDPRDERVWEQGWDGHAAAQARRTAALTWAQKLDWLEQAHARVLRMQTQPGTFREGPQAPGTPPDEAV